MLSDGLREWLRLPLSFAATHVLALGIRPSHVTLIAPSLTVFVVAPLLATQHIALGLLFLVVGYSCDAIDGTMARLANRSSPWGRFLDLMADRISDSALWVGVILYCQAAGSSLILAAIAAALWQLQSQTSVAAQAVGAAISLGYFQRLERLLLVIAGLILASLHVMYALDVTNAILVCVSASVLFYRGRQVRCVLDFSPSLSVTSPEEP